MSKIVTFGEIMLRLAPKGYLRFLQEPEFQATFGGGEANVAVSLANYGRDAGVCDEITGRSDRGSGYQGTAKIWSRCRRHFDRTGSRVRIYYLGKGASQRPSKVVYDRAHSAIGESCRDDFDWNEIFKDAGWFHFTGITPALGPNVAEICKDAVKEAKKRNITVSCDLNFRKNLWTSEQAAETMGELMKYTDVCIADEEDAEKVFGIKADATDINAGKLNRNGYKDVARKLIERFDLDYAAITLRTSISASDNKVGGHAVP